VLSSAGVVWASAQARTLLGEPGTTFDLGAVLSAAHPGDRRQLATTITAALAGEPRQLLWRYHHPARGWRHLSTRFRPLPVVDGEARMVASITIDVTDEQERLLDQARSEERQRIARDLHDDALQQFTGLRWMLVARDTDDEVMAELDALEASVRSIASRMHTPVWSQGLRTSLDHLASGAVTPTTCEYRGDLDGVPPIVADRLWRIARELLRNVDRHARASSTTMTVDVSGDQVHLTVCDDGVGIDRDTITAARLAGHLGVVSMREAALSAGGSFEMAPRPEGGTRVTLMVPLAG
jgi:signal transduction histidine kinase